MLKEHKLVLGQYNTRCCVEIQHKWILSACKNHLPRPIEFFKNCHYVPLTLCTILVEIYRLVK